MSQNADVEVFTECLAETVQMTRAQWQIIADASERCGLSPTDYMLMAALQSARRHVPAACQAPLVETAMPGLFGGDVSICSCGRKMAIYHGDEGTSGYYCTVCDAPTREEAK